MHASSGSTSLATDADTEALTTTLRQVVPRVAYLIPDFHNPTGTLMGDEGRADVADALSRTRTTAIIDESMVALALDGQQMPSAVRVLPPGRGQRGQPEQAVLGRPPDRLDPGPDRAGWTRSSRRG